MLSSEPGLDNIIYRVEHLFRRSGGSGGSGPPGHRDRGDRACFRPSRLILRGGRRELVDSVGHRLEFDASELRNDGRLAVGVQAPTLYFVDVLDQLLEETRARGAVFRQALLDPPWGLRFESGAALTSVAMVRSDAWLVPDGAPAVRIGAGDIAIVNGPGPFTLVDRPGTGPSHLVTADTYCAGTGGVDLGRSLALGARACGVGFDAMGGGPPRGQRRHCRGDRSPGRVRRRVRAERGVQAPPWVDPDGAPDHKPRLTDPLL